MKIISYITRICQYIFAPIRCFVCSYPGSYICQKHARYLLWYPTCCYMCTRPTKDGRLCQQDQWPLVWVVIGWYYTPLIKAMIHVAKYWWTYHILSYFWEKIAVLLATYNAIWDAYQQKNLIVTYIPMHHRKQHYIRWYNQAQKLALYLAETMNIPIISSLIKTKNTKSHATQGRQWREKDGDMYIIDPTFSIPQWSMLLLVDDVYTTWKTMKEASMIIKKHSPSTIIWGVAIARNT